MRPCWVAIKEAILPRGKGVHLLLNISIWNPDGNYVVAATLDRRFYRALYGLTYDRALELFEQETLLPGPRGDSSLKAVLDRCMEKRGEIPGRWEGSIGEYASRHHKIGSWEWVQTLVEYRKRCEAERRVA